MCLPILLYSDLVTVPRRPESRNLLGHRRADPLGRRSGRDGLEPAPLLALNGTVRGVQQARHGRHSDHGRRAVLEGPLSARSWS